MAGYRKIGGRHSDNRPKSEADALSKTRGGSANLQYVLEQAGANLPDDLRADIMAVVKEAWDGFKPLPKKRFEDFSSDRRGARRGVTLNQMSEFMASMVQILVVLSGTKKQTALVTVNDVPKLLEELDRLNQAEGIALDGIARLERAIAGMEAGQEVGLALPAGEPEPVEAEVVR